MDVKVEHLCAIPPGHVPGLAVFGPRQVVFAPRMQALHSSESASHCEAVVARAKRH